MLDEKLKSAELQDEELDAVVGGASIYLKGIDHSTSEEVCDEIPVPAQYTSATDIASFTNMMIADYKKRKIDVKPITRKEYDATMAEWSKYL